MKKTIITFAALLGLTLGCAMSTSAMAQVSQAPQEKGQDQAMKSQAGKIASVDTAKNEVAIKDEKGAQKTLSISPDTKIMKDGKDITLAELKVGDRVMYEADDSASPAVAKSLTVMSGKS